MREPIQKYFQMGTIHWMSFPIAKYDILESAKTILSDAFFDAIEIGPMPNDVIRRQMKELLAQSHMRVCYGAQPRLLASKLNPNHLDETERQKAEATLREAVDEAACLGAQGIAFLAGKWQPETQQQAYEQLLKTTRSVCAYAAEKGMMVELEVFDFDIDKAALIGPAPLAARFAADMRTSHQNFGLVVDLSHIPLTYETSKFVIQTLRPYITHLHIGNAVVKKEAPAFGDLHPRFGYPNSANDVDELVDFLTVLKQEGFFNARQPYTLSMEVTTMEGEDAHIVLANTKRVIQRAWALVEE